MAPKEMVDQLNTCGIDSMNFISTFSNSQCVNPEFHQPKRHSLYGQHSQMSMECGWIKTDKTPCSCSTKSFTSLHVVIVIMSKVSFPHWDRVRANGSAFWHIELHSSKFLLHLFTQFHGLLLFFVPVVIHVHVVWVLLFQCVGIRYLLVFGGTRGEAANISCPTLNSFLKDFL